MAHTRLANRRDLSEAEKRTVALEFMRHPKNRAFFECILEQGGDYQWPGLQAAFTPEEIRTALGANGAATRSNDPGSTSEATRD